MLKSLMISSLPYEALLYLRMDMMAEMRRELLEGAWGILLRKAKSRLFMSTHMILLAAVVAIDDSEVVLV